MTARTDAEAHKRMSERRNEAYERKKEKATGTKGLLIVNTGTGKGKSSAAFGMAVRAVAHGLRLGVVQFIKGALPTGERDVLARFPEVRFETLGEGFTWITQNRERDVATARRGWDVACEMLRDPAYDMVILDELNVVLRYEYLPLDEVLEELAKRPPEQHAVVTGRHAPDRMIEAADLVTEMRAVKHPFREQGIKAQPGVEY
jgi:cob(I)alamin adenosyltransferase